MTTACYVAYDEEAALGRSLRSVTAYVERVVIVDCAFTSRPGPPSSSDGQRAVAEEVCASAGVPLTYITSARALEEHDARNLYLEEARRDQWLLLMDADEVLYGDHGQVLALLEDLRGVAAADVGVRVFTTAVLTPQNAPDVSEETYRLRPVISTAGWMPKLVRRTVGLRHSRVEVAPGVWTHHGLQDGMAVLDGSAVRTDVVYIVNDHVAQDLAGYQRDFAWEMAQRHGHR